MCAVGGGEVGESLFEEGGETGLGGHEESALGEGEVGGC